MMEKHFAADAFMARVYAEPSRTDTWFAWRPVRLGALGTGRLVWLRRVWRNRCAGVTIYQNLSPQKSGSFPLYVSEVES